IDDRRSLAADDDHLLSFQRLVLDDRMQDVAEILLHDRCAHRGIGRVQQRHGSLAERVVENGRRECFGCDLAQLPSLTAMQSCGRRARAWPPAFLMAGKMWAFLEPGIAGYLGV